MWTLLIAIAGAGPADLAPAPRDVHELLATQERLVGRAATLGTATQRLHNAAARSLAGGSDCRDPQVRSLLTRAQHLGEAWRDTLQSARAMQPVLEERATAATTAPLLTRAVREQIAATGTTLRRDAARYAEAAAWQRAYAPARCLDDSALATATDGLNEPAGRAESTVAVLVGPGSVLCPSGRTAPGAAILSPALACVVPEDQPCDCNPRPVAPGAVLVASPPDAATDP